jgi:hypothetical protein
MVVRMIAWGFPGWSKSRRVRAQQAICTMRRKAMQRRKEDSLAILGGAYGWFVVLFVVFIGVMEDVALLLLLLLL